MPPLNLEKLSFEKNFAETLHRFRQNLRQSNEVTEEEYKEGHYDVKVDSSGTLALKSSGGRGVSVFLTTKSGHSLFQRVHERLDFVTTPSRVLTSEPAPQSPCGVVDDIEALLSDNIDIIYDLPISVPGSQPWDKASILAIHGMVYPKQNVSLDLMKEIALAKGALWKNCQYRKVSTGVSPNPTSPFPTSNSTSESSTTHSDLDFDKILDPTVRFMAASLQRLAYQRGNLDDRVWMVILTELLSSYWEYYEDNTEEMLALVSPWFLDVMALFHRNLATPQNRSVKRILDHQTALYLEDLYDQMIQQECKKEVIEIQKQQRVEGEYTPSLWAEMVESITSYAAIRDAIRSLDPNLFTPEYAQRKGDFIDEVQFSDTSGK